MVIVGGDVERSTAANRLVGAAASAGVAFLLIADAFVVVALAIVHPHGWLPPFIAFGLLLVGLVWFQAWSWRHRHDDG